MIHVDGSQRSGSGTLVRFAVALGAVLGCPVRVRRIRARREKPGLRPQHVAAIRACAALCGASTEGVAVGSGSLCFRPGGGIRGGSFRWDIGTAGSTTMLALGVLPVACFAREPLVAMITGGVFQDFAPSPHHLEHVLLPVLGRMGVAAELRVLRAGYLPRGTGAIELRVRPAPEPLRALLATHPGAVRRIAGVALSSHLDARRVSQRMAESCRGALAAAGLTAAIGCVADRTALDPGASLAVWAETGAGCVLGSDRAGARHRSAEAIGRFVARRLLEDLGTGAATDRHLADQLVVFAALAEGTTCYTVPRETEHLASNLWLAERFGASTRCADRRIEIRGLARPPTARGRARAGR